MFGGFDGNFYSDLHILHTNKTAKESVIVAKSTLHPNLASAVNVPELSDIEFVLRPSVGQNPPVVHANKSLVLYRLIERELRTTDHNSGNAVFRMPLPELLSMRANKTRQVSDPVRFQCNQFLQRVFGARAGEKIFLQEVSEEQRAEFLVLLEFCHCEKLVQPVTCLRIRQLRDLCVSLELMQLSSLFDQISTYMRDHLHRRLVRDIQAQMKTQVDQALGIDQIMKQLTPENHRQIDSALAQFEREWYFDLEELNYSGESVLSPEDKINGQSEKILCDMIKCRNLDYFYDVVFVLDSNEKIRVNSAVLSARSEYFRAMFSSRYSYRESYFTHYFDDGQNHEVRQLKRIVTLRGVPKIYLAAIIQYLYSDNFIIVESNIQFYLNLMLYADYFMIPRLSEICQLHLAKFVKPKNCLELYLVAQAHNAEQLEQFCLHFIATNHSAILASQEWKDLDQKSKALEDPERGVLPALKEKIDDELE